MKNYIYYRGELIARNSEAFRLWEEKRWHLLDAHIAHLKQVAKYLQDRY